jgi:hypothetical protein
MAHGYSLRPNSKGRRRPQSTDKTNEVEGTSTSASTNTSTVDPRPETPDTPSSAAHNPPGSIATSSATSKITTTRYRVERRPETWEEIQAARKRQEARSTAQAVRIHREQIRRGYEGELRALRARVVALHRECEVMVERARRESERNWAIERGEIAVVVDAEDDGDGEGGNLVGSDLDWEEDAEAGMAVDQNYGPSSLTTDNDKDQWPSRSSTFLSETNLQSPPPLRRTQQRQQQDDERGLGETHNGSCSRRNRNRPSRSHGSHPQPLRRQRAQLMTTPTPSHGTYGTAVPPETGIRFGGIDGGNDSEMGG